MADAQAKIVVAERLSDHAMNRLGEVGGVALLQSCEAHSLRAAVEDCAALLVRSYAQVTSEIIAAAPNLKVIGRAGVGVENIDVASASAAGVIVVYTPAASTQAVAELTMGLMVALERRVIGSEQRMRAGEFAATRDGLARRQLNEMTLGIVGFGRIGSRVAQIAHHGFGMRVVYNDILEIESTSVPADAMSKDTLFAEADVVSLHVPLTAETRRLINANSLAGMKEGTLVINTARGGVVDAQALADMLHCGQISGAAIDVFDPEPPGDDHPLLHAPNCILTPHIGSRTRLALEAMNDVVEDVIAVLHGKSPRYAYPAS